VVYALPTRPGDDAHGAVDDPGTMRAPQLIVAAVAGALALSACGGAPAAPTTPATSSAAATPSHANVEGTFAAPGGGQAVTYDPSLVPVGATAKVSSSESAGATTVKLTVTGLLPNRAYGAHAHVKPCGADGMAAGPHFQLKQDPVTPSVDPAYANPQNEIWLDFTTDAQGMGEATTTVPWTFPADRRAKAVIIHEKATATEAGKAGVAGARPACMSVDF
jgi:Cu-Zn family superoxide dismutase